MTSPYMFEKPLGMRDTLPTLQHQKEQLLRKMEAIIASWGYAFMRTPALEYHETVGEASAIPEDQLFRLLDRQGRTVVLRPDMTAPIARALASSLKHEPLPVRVGYSTHLYRKQEYEGGKPAEFEQTGVELVGDSTASADVEVIALMVSLLQQAGVQNVKVALGHAGFVKAFLQKAVGDQESADKLRNDLYDKNDVGFHKRAHSLGLSHSTLSKLNRFLESRRLSNKQTLAIIPKLLEGQTGIDIQKNIDEMMQLFEKRGINEVIDLDLTMVSHLNYYTGCVFEAHGGNAGAPLGNGGRYDELLQKFQRPSPATGFGIRLDRLTELFSGQVQENHRHCVLYKKAFMEEAINVATEKRQRGETVVLQDIDGVSDIEAFTQQFTDLAYFVDESCKEDPSS